MPAPNHTIRFSIFLILAACAPPAEDPIDVEGASEAAMLDEETPAPVVCDGTYAFNAVRDRFKPEQTFRLVVHPNAALELGLETTHETFTVTAKLESGGKARSVVSTFEKQKDAFIGNLSGAPQTYQVTVTRSEVKSPKDTFHFSCNPIAFPPRISGLADDAVCVAGQACLKSAPGFSRQEPEPSTCSSDFANIGDPAAGSQPLGFCR